MKKYDIALIGAGSASLAFCAKIDKRFSVAVCERNLRVGKKLLATGNGRGNFCNCNLSTKNYHGDTDFVQNILEKFSKEDNLNFVESLGMLWQAEEDKIYPATFSANTILDVFRNVSAQKNIDFLCEFLVEDITFSTSEQQFLIKSKDQIICANKVVVACGGMSGKGFGTDGKGYKLLQNFGHTLTKTYPSLVQLNADVSALKVLKGSKFEAKCKYFCGEKQIYSNQGEVLFCDYGLSGNAIFDASSHICRENFQNMYISIDFFPNYDVKYLDRVVTARQDNYLLGIAKNQLATCIYKIAKDKSQYAQLLKDFRIKLKGVRSFENSQVTAGGICTKDFFEDTLQSRLQKNLYAIGEVLNVDGDCGGYNLHFAFACGVLCANAINKQA